MTKVNVSAWVKVKDGPNLSLGSELEPETVAQSTVVLDAAGGTAPEKTADLLAAGGTAVLVALSAKTADGKPAEITVTPVNGSDEGDPVIVTGSLVVANAGVLGALVNGGPRALTLTNAGAAPVTVEIIAGRAD